MPNHPPAIPAPNLDAHWARVRADVAEFGYTAPSARTWKCARRLFPRVLTAHAGAFEFYAAPDGGIVLDAHAAGREFNASVLLICGPGNRVLCSLDAGDRTGALSLPGDVEADHPFIRQAFADLAAFARAQRATP